MMNRTLAVRLDSVGDMLVTGPAIRALARTDDVTVLAGPGGTEVAGLLPGVSDVLTWQCPWIVADPSPVDRGDVCQVTDRIASGSFDSALIFTSFHQSPLPTALMLRMAGVEWVGAISVDYPGSLLDLRESDPGDVPEPERALHLARSAGYELPADDDGRLQLVGDLPDVSTLTGDEPYVVVHPGCTASARRWSAGRWRDTVALLTRSGYRVAVSGDGADRRLCEYVAGGECLDLSTRTDLGELAAVIAGAEAIVVGNTGPAHLSAAVGTPVVSLFAPTVSAERWRPYGVPLMLLGDQFAPCRDSRARECPVPGHPCLERVMPDDVVEALIQLRAEPARATTSNGPMEVLR